MGENILFIVLYFFYPLMYSLVTSISGENNANPVLLKDKPKKKFTFDMYATLWDKIA